MSQNGKGSRQRPKSVDYKTWEKNYNQIFNKNKSKSRSKKN
jgi:hypothetical protein